jgi:hypothetical protein
MCDREGYEQENYECDEAETIFQGSDYTTGVCFSIQE